MKTFYYRAKNGPDEVIEGTMDAHTTQEVVDALTEKGYLATLVKEEIDEKEKRRAFRFRFIQGVTLKERLLFTRQVSMLLQAKVPVLRALQLVEEQTDNPYFKKIIAEVIEKVKDGKTLSATFKQYPNIFPELFQAMVKAGEESGTLDMALKKVAAYYQQQYDFFMKVKNALAYPLLIAAVGVLTLVFIFSHVIPRIIPLLRGLNVELPLPTKILIGMSGWFSDSWGWILFGGLLIFLIFKRAEQNDHFKRYLSNLVHAIPIYGELQFKSEFARFCRALEMTLKSGMSLLSAINVSFPLVRDVLMREHILQSMGALRGGGGLGKTLKRTHFFPPIVYNLICLGEETGQLEDSFSYIAQLYESDCEEIVKTFTTLLEPMLVLIVGGIVGIVVGAVLLPIFQLNFVQL